MQDAIRTFRIFAYILLAVALFLAVVSADTYFGIKFLAQFGLQATRNNNELFCVSVAFAFFLGIGLWKNWGVALFLACVMAGVQLYGQFKLPAGLEFLDISLMNWVFGITLVLFILWLLFSGALSKWVSHGSG